MFKKFLQPVLVVLFILTAASCANDNDLLMEEARFLVDSCQPSVAATLPNCTSAIAKVDQIQLTDPTNLDAAGLESSAYLARAGFTALGLSSNLSGLNGDSAEDFAEFLDYIDTVEVENGSEIVLGDLRSSVTAVSGVLGVDGSSVTPGETNHWALYQLGMLQAVDAFIRPVKLAGTGAADVSTTTIDATVATTVKEDFVNADNNITASGTTDTDILNPVRKNYCRCSLQTPSGGATAGFTAACLRDLMRCTLSTTLPTEQDYDLDLDTDVTDCVALLTPTVGDFASCQTGNTVE
ncbi:MAG: hypothetical protein Q7S00_07370 [bacterium]|nr:hypothetical protein [bacterium]